MQPVQQVPRPAQRLASQYHLGELQAVYEHGKDLWLARLPGLFALLVGAALLYYFFSAYDAIFSNWPAWQMVFVPIIGCGWLCVGLWMIFFPWFAPEQRVFVYQEGLVYTTRHSEVMRWTQMERFWKDVRFDRRMRKFSSYVVRRNDRAFFVFRHDLLDSEKLGMLLEEEITRRLLPRAIAAYDAGDTVLFDDVAVSKRWLRVRQGSKKLAWRDFASMHIDERSIELYKKNMNETWATLKVAAIPNVSILKGLIDHAQREAMLATSPHIMAYRSGFSVLFGPLAINQQGVKIENGGHILPWDEIAAIGVGESEVIIRRKDSLTNWYVFPLWMIPDAPGLAALLNYILQTAR
ncbi:MAG TPA: DUF6585 family protein [Ktedonobacteraceae bacterium]|nr:DUF6585 family protein [Ktedonobacteraceae bacterium]